MKKILFLALSALFIGGVSSCKDYEDEIRADHKEDIKDIQNQHSADVTAINGTIATLQGSITALQAELNTLKSQCDADHNRINTIENTITTLQGQVADLEAGLAEKADQAAVDSLASALDSAKEDLLAQIAAVDSLAKANGVDIAELRATVAGMDSRLNAAIAQLASLRNSVSSQITGITLQDMTTPVLAGTSINVGGVKSTFLCSYVGQWGNNSDVEFFGVTLGEKKPLSNAGKIFFSVDPIQNFTGAEIKLIDDRMAEAPVALTAPVPEKDGRHIQAGISRAAGNFVYESTAYYKTTAAANANLIEYEQELKKIAKDVKTLVKEKKASGVKTLVMDVVMAAAKHSNTTAYALAADYTAPNGQTKTVTTPLNIAVKAIKPLAFGLDVKGALGNPNLHRSLPYIKEMLDKLEGKLDMGGAIGEVELKFTLQDNHWVAVDMIGAITGNVWTKVYLDLDWYGDEGFSHALAGEINKGLNAPDGVVAQIENAINNKITSVIGSAQNSKPVHDADKIISFLNKTIEFLATKVDNINLYLEPVMFWGNKEAGYHHLSSLQSAPTYVNGSTLDLYASTYTMDILNPAYLKGFVVKNLTTGDEVNKATLVYSGEITFANKTIGASKAIDGDCRELSVTFPSSGLYEITYGAVDYYGNVRNLKYYVNVTL